MTAANRVQIRLFLRRLPEYLREPYTDKQRYLIIWVVRKINALGGQQGALVSQGVSVLGEEGGDEGHGAKGYVGRVGSGLKGHGAERMVFAE